jgi:hypothetical protein
LGCKHHIDWECVECFSSTCGAVTDLDELVPAAGDNDGVLGVGAEADARNPLGVALLGDGVLAVTEGVPELDGSVARAGDDLAVVGREADGEDVVGVANESSGGSAGGELPQTQGLVPRGRQSVSAIGRDDLDPTNISPSSRFVLLAKVRMGVAGHKVNVHSRRRCESGREEIAWGNRIGSHRG